LEDRVALGFADLLKDDLLGNLGGDAPQWRGVPVHADLAAHLDAGGQLIGLFQRDLVDRILDLVFTGYHGFVNIGRDLAGLLVELAAHVFLRLVELARSQGNGLLDRTNDDLGLDALFPAEKLDALIQGACHTSLTLFTLSYGVCSTPVCPSCWTSYRISPCEPACFRCLFLLPDACCFKSPGSVALFRCCRAQCPRCLRRSSGSCCFV